MNISQAISWLYPEASPLEDFIVQDDGNGAYIKEWNLKEKQPTDALLKTAWDELQADNKKNEYKELRKKEYLPIQDQLDMLYWDMKNDTKKWLSHRDAIKSKYPKS